MEEKVNNSRKEFQAYLRKWVWDDKSSRYKNGIDVGCGTSRVDDLIISIDQNPEWKYAHAQIVHDCTDLEIFKNDTLDFIYSSHCLEDFEVIPVVFMRWWTKLKREGLMLLLLPDMENCDCVHCKGGSRYKKVEEGGNPSHKTNVGKKYINEMLQSLHERGDLKYEILQQDTINHNETSSIDFVIKKIQ